MSFAVAQYKVSRVETVSPAQLVVQLYDGALRFMRQATMLIEKGDVAGKGVALMRSHAIVSELQATLDASKAPALAEQLDQLYDFVLHSLGEANIGNDAQPIEAAMRVMLELRSAWALVAEGKT